MRDIYIGIGLIIFMYLLYLLTIIINPRRLEKYINKGKETNLIKGRYKIDYSKVNKKLVANLFAIDNSILLGITYMVLMYNTDIMDIGMLILRLLIAFIIFIISIVITYLMIGKYIKGKEEK